MCHSTERCRLGAGEFRAEAQADSGAPLTHRVSFSQLPGVSLQRLQSPAPHLGRVALSGSGARQAQVQPLLLAGLSLRLFPENHLTLAGLCHPLLDSTEPMGGNCAVTGFRILLTGRPEQNGDFRRGGF